MGKLGGLLLAAMTGTAAAQPAGSPDTGAVFRGGFEEVAGWVSRAADMVPAEKYGYPLSGIC